MQKEEKSREKIRKQIDLLHIRADDGDLSADPEQQPGTGVYILPILFWAI